MSPTRAAPTGPPQPSQAAGSDGATIFLIEEDDAVRDALAMSLRAAGHPVTAFSSGQMFLDDYQSGDGGCLVVDMDLTDLNAMELLHTLAASGIALPAILTSRRLKRRVSMRGLPYMQILFLDKPFGIDELLEHIRVALEVSSGRQAGS